MNAVVFLAPAPRPQPSTAHATRGRWIPASCCVWPCSLDEIFKSHHSLCARLERMPVSTWNMEVWTEVMTSDLIWVTSKVLKIEGVHGAHGLGKLKHLCHELLPLGGVRANVVTPRCSGQGVLARASSNRRRVFCAARAYTSRMRRRGSRGPTRSHRRADPAPVRVGTKPNRLSRIPASHVCTQPVRGE